MNDLHYDQINIEQLYLTNRSYGFLEYAQQSE